MLKANVALISTIDLGFKVGARTILDRVNLSVHDREIVTIIGPNGAGKSTLIKLLLGLDKSTSGRVTRREKLRVGYVPQRFPVAPNVPLSVRRLLTLTYRATAKELTQALHETGIEHLIDARVSDLSGGVRR